ncbi:MAG: DUF4112 domain-containing protein [Pseudomonadota bacterium]
MIPGEHFEHYRRYRALAQLLDAAVRVPGTRVGVGLDFLLGLLPGIGDLTSGALGADGLYVARRLGVSRSVWLRMAGNLVLDSVVGSVPVLGDLFDLGFRANLRNLALLDRWLEAPTATRRASLGLVVGVGLGLFALVGLAAWAVVALAGWLSGLAT